MLEWEEEEEKEEGEEEPPAARALPWTRRGGSSPPDPPDGFGGWEGHGRVETRGVAGGAEEGAWAIVAGPFEALSGFARLPA